MTELFAQLGIDWRLLLAQGVNFFVVLAVLTVFVYRPLLRLMAERRRKIELGLTAGEEAERRLRAIDDLRGKRMAEAEAKAVGIVSQAELDAKMKARDIAENAKTKAEQLLAEAQKTAERRAEDELERLRAGAGTLVREAIAKAVAEKPEAIDAALVRGAQAALSAKRI